MNKKEFDEYQNELFDGYFELKGKEKEAIERLNTLKEGKAKEHQKNIVLDIKELKNDIENAIIHHNMGLIIKLVYNNKIDTIEYEDLFQEAKLAMLDCIKRYDRESNTKFSTYAYSWINGKLKKYTIENGRTIRVNHLAFYNYSTFKKEKDRLSLELHRNPSDKEIMDELNNSGQLYRVCTMSKAKKENLRKWDKKYISLMNNIEAQTVPASIDEPICDNDTSALFEVIEDTSIERPDEVVFSNFEYNNKKEELINIINYYKKVCIFDEVVDVLKLRYGIYDDRLKTLLIDTIKRVGKEEFGAIEEDGLTLNQVSSILNVSRESVRIYEAMGIRQLRLLAGKEANVEIKEGHSYKFLSKDLRLNGSRKTRYKTEIEFLDYDKNILSVDNKTRYVKGLKEGNSKLTLYDKNNDRVVTYNFEVKPKYLSLRKENKNE